MSGKRIYKDKQTALKAKYRWINNNNKVNKVGVSFRLDKESDKDIIDYIANQKDKVGFFRRIIIEDMNKNKSEG